MEADDWSDDWADCYYLFLFLEGKNFPEVQTEVLKPPRLLIWLLENFDAVRLLIADAIRKKAFFEFQARERRERSEREVLAFKRERGTL